MFPEGRIFDFAIIGVLALIVVGPKDLPVLMRKVGRFVAHMRSMAAEFRASFDEMARQSELDELRREVEALRSGQTLQTAVGLGKESGVHEVFDDIHIGLRNGEIPIAAPEGDRSVAIQPPAVESAAAPDHAAPPPGETPAPTNTQAADSQPARAAL